MNRAPSMCQEHPKLTADRIRDLALAEVLATRLGAQVALVALAVDNNAETNRSGDYTTMYAVDGAVELARKLSERLHAAILGLDAEIADVDLTEAEVETDSEGGDGGTS